MDIARGSTSKIEEFPECSVSQGGKLIVNTNRGPYSLEPSSLGLKILYVKGNCYNQVIGELSRELVWLRWNDFQHSNLWSLISLKNLRVLKLDGFGFYGKQCLQELWKTDNNAPVQLRELVINSCLQLQRFPKSIGCLKYLKKMVTSYAVNLKSLPEEFCLLESLEHLRLNARELSSLPNSFGYLRNLRHLDLCSCVKLTRLPVSFKELILLQHLHLGGCSKLTLESDILENMMKLEYLNIQGCDQSEELPHHITNQPSLTQLYCAIKRLREVPVNIGQLRKLQGLSIGGELLTSLPTSMLDLSSLTSLRIGDCAQLKCLPDSLGCLINVLCIYNCPKLKYLPDSMGRLNCLVNLRIDYLGVRSLPKSIRQLVNLQEMLIRRCPISEYDLGAGLFTSLKRIELEGTEVSKISMSEDTCPALKNILLRDNGNLKKIEVLPNSLDSIVLEGNPKLEALPSFAQLAFLREFNLKGCYRVKKIHGLEHCTALERLTAHSRWEEAGIECLERMERLTSVRLQAVSKSGVESCIQSIQKWPREDIIVCTRAVPDAATLVKSFAFPNLSVVDSFAKRKIKSDPFLKWPCTARCILLCFVVNCESPKTSLHLGYSAENMERKTYIVKYGMEVEMGKWVWTTLFTQHPIKGLSRVHIIRSGCDGRRGDSEGGFHSLMGVSIKLIISVEQDSYAY